MPSGIVVPSDLLSFQGVGPAGVAKRTFNLPKDHIVKHLIETGNRSVYDEAFLVPETVANPAGIWQGLGRRDQDGALCFAGVPQGEFARQHGVEIDIPEDAVFLVYTTDQMVVTKWRYCEQDPERPGFPIDHDSRFGERLWPQD